MTIRRLIVLVVAVVLGMSVTCRRACAQRFTPASTRQS